MPRAPKNAGAAIDRVAFADAAEMHRHPFARQEHGARLVVDLNRAIVDERQAATHLAHVGHDVVLVVIEFPETRQHAERDVELAVGPLAHLSRRREHLADVGARRAQGGRPPID